MKKIRVTAPLILLLFLFIGFNAFAHKQSVHVEITKASALSSEGLAAYLSDAFQNQESDFVRHPMLVRLSPIESSTFGVESQDSTELLTISRGVEIKEAWQGL